jgi:hypothetical protein
MEEMVAYCGLLCHDCPTIRATAENDAEAKARIAAHWTQVYPTVFPDGVRPEEVECTGCKSGGVRFFLCRDCKYRECAIARGVDNCALCPEYETCKLMQDYVANVAPEVKPVLEAIREGRDYRGFDTFK